MLWVPVSGRKRKRPLFSRKRPKISITGYNVVSLEVKIMLTIKNNAKNKISSEKPRV